MKIDFLKEAGGLFEYSQKIRRDLHMHPELGFQEVRTAEFVAHELRQMGMLVTTGIAETGVVAILESGKPGRVCMLRFDMDALPISEETGAEYTSRNPGIMHACGHDAHVAIGITVARLFSNHLNHLKGTIKFVFQPAEEGLGGAERMVKEGVLENPRPDFSLGIHVWNESPVGWFGITPGPIMAASEIFRVVIRGRGGHGALPSRAIDPIVASAQVISAIQTIVSRNVHPQKTAVISVTAIHGGQAHNVIPQEVELKGTIRTFDTDTRELVLDRFQHVVDEAARMMGCQAIIEIKSLTPAVVNNDQVTAIVLNTVNKLWSHSTIDTNYQTMGSEDMAFYLQEIPGCFLFIGSANQQLGLNAAHHHPRFDIDEKVLPMAAGLLASTAIQLLD